MRKDSPEILKFFLVCMFCLFFFPFQQITPKEESFPILISMAFKSELHTSAKFL